jgi:predicted Rossmann-fold nucleotide-binding protein
MPDHTVPAKAVICVFGAEVSNAHLRAARELGQALRKNISLVYGGGTIGIMGEIAKTLVSLPSPAAVHDVIPRALLTAERNGKQIEFVRTTIVGLWLSMLMDIMMGCLIGSRQLPRPAM